ncbi:restriction endonuclease subunit S [Mycobacteroides chelonae]|uniref:restriction endonuclease subunit S n=1 Tax=Mycobacteroides chelonae TaxID=1774 RepID=UPI0007A0EF6D|nr:restriction endonuclease subunit S [Mycobacteroides chelonae]AMW18490.1 restriction modification system DNA specificity domain protein [Mycobacterium sp. QIA-37]
MAKLGDEIELAYGKSLPARSRIEGPVDVYGSNGVVGSHNESYVPGPGIVVGRKGSVGEVAYSSGEFWPIDTTYYVMQKRDHNWRFLYHLLHYCDLTGLNSHSTVPGLNREDAYKIQVSLPDRATEDRLASALDWIEVAADKESDAMVRTGQLKAAAMHQLFSRGLRGEAQKETEIGPVPESWDVITINDVALKTQYGLSVRGQAQGQFPILRMNCQDDGRVRFRDLQYVDLDEATFSAFRLDDGDLLFNRTNSIEHVGRTAIFEDAREAVFASYLVRLKVDALRCLPRFLNYFMNRREVQQDIKRLASRAVGQANINATKLRTIAFPLPSSLSEQAEIIAILNALDRKIDLHRRKRDVLDQLFKLLLHKLMTGEISINDLDLNALPSVGGSAA